MSEPSAPKAGGLWARLTRALAHDLVGVAAEREHEGRAWLGVTSGGVFFPLCRTSELAEVGA